MLKASLRQHPYVAVVMNLLLLVACYAVTRLAFYGENAHLFPSASTPDINGILRGGLRFDFAAIAYSNVLWLLLLFLPIPQKEGQRWQTILKVLFVVTNAICLAANLADAVYYPFIKRRATASIFQEFRGDDLSGIIGIELLHHWYLTLLFVILVAALWRLYLTPRPTVTPRRRYFITYIIGIIVSAVAVVAGMRGGLDPEQRPLHNGMARQYVSQPVQAVLVQNTPFSIFRTIFIHGYPRYSFFPSDDALEKEFDPVHKGNDDAYMSDDFLGPVPDNVVIILLESFSSEYSARLNPSPTDASYSGYMPFLDSLMSESLTFSLTLANGLSSIDAQASVLTSLPMMIESIMSSHATMNAFDGLGTYLKRMGYSTAYFHGADNGSLSIDGFVRTCGFDKYHGRTEYGNDADWDHHWGIWDEPFMQYFAHQLTTMPKPFCAGLFTLTSHHPFQIPKEYRDTFPEGALPIYKTIRYTDHALRRFFETARQQRWYNNTLFVITGDHTNLQADPRYINDLGRFCVPLLFFHPTDPTFRGHRDGVAQHIDILPTVLSHVGYPGSYFAFGQDLLSTPAAETEAISYINGIYQFVQGNYLLQHDGEYALAFYDISTDPTLQSNLLPSIAADDNKQYQRMQRRLEAIIQQYTSRMNDNRLTAQP